jgi:IS30 family transposase
MKTLTLTAKGEIIRKLDEGYSVTALSRNYGVAKSTICGIRKKKEHIFKALKNSFSGINKQKRIKKAELLKMEAALYAWYVKGKQKF